MNNELVVCDPTYFRVVYEINPFMDIRVQPDPAAAAAEHEAIVSAHRAAGRRIRRLPTCRRSRLRCRATR